MQKEICEKIAGQKQQRARHDRCEHEVVVPGEDRFEQERAQSGPAQHDFDEQPARILISEETRDQLDSSFLTERVGDFNLKGKNEPVTVFRVLGRATPDANTIPEEKRALGGPES